MPATIAVMTSNSGSNGIESTTSVARMITRIEGGVEGIESDVALTADGVVVLISNSPREEDRDVADLRESPRS